MYVQVVNIHKSKFDVYIGRSHKDGYWGNPIVIGQKCPVCGEGHYKSGATLACYEKYLVERLENDPEFNRRFYELAHDGVRLGCFCKPGPCHGDIMKKYLDQYIDTQLRVPVKEFPMSEMLTIYADGGCEGNHQKDGPRQAYASIAVRYGEKELIIRPEWISSFTEQNTLDPKKVLTMRLRKASTNNEAEFGAAIMALGYVKELVNRNKGKSIPPVEIVMDSALVVGAVTGKKKIKAENLKPLFEVVDTILTQAKSFTDINFVQKPRDVVEAVLGH